LKFSAGCLGREGKKSVLRSDHYDLLIDDMLRYLKIAKERGKRAIAFANPWDSNLGDLKVAACCEIRDLVQTLG
jgi:hypothetical protein